MNDNETNSYIDYLDPVFTLSIASNLSSIPISSIRQYIDKGLIIPFKKDSNRHLFSSVDILRLQYISKLLNEEGLNIAGIRALLAVIPCWKVRNCNEKNRLSCQAYNSTSNPCWEASEKGRMCKNEDCRDCKVYRFIEENINVKSFLKTLV
jgi:MerR family transcriptional regulator/heat shock protein HspR